MFRKIALVTYRKDFEWREIERKTNKQKQKTAKLWLQSEVCEQIRAWMRTSWKRQNVNSDLSAQSRRFCPSHTCRVWLEPERTLETINSTTSNSSTSVPKDLGHSKLQTKIVFEIEDFTFQATLTFFYCVSHLFWYEINI